MGLPLCVTAARDQRADSAPLYSIFLMKEKLDMKGMPGGILAQEPLYFLFLCHSQSQVLLEKRRAAIAQEEENSYCYVRKPV